MTDNEKFMAQRRGEANVLEQTLNNLQEYVDFTLEDTCMSEVMGKSVQAMREVINQSGHFKAFYDWRSDNPKDGFRWFVVTTDRASGVKETELEKRFSHRYK